MGLKIQEKSVKSKYLYKYSTCSFSKCLFIFHGFPIFIITVTCTNSFVVQKIQVQCIFQFYFWCFCYVGRHPDFKEQCTSLSASSNVDAFIEPLMHFIYFCCTWQMYFTVYFYKIYIRYCNLYCKYLLACNTVLKIPFNTSRVSKNQWI